MDGVNWSKGSPFGDRPTQRRSIAKAWVSRPPLDGKRVWIGMTNLCAVRGANVQQADGLRPMISNVRIGILKSPSASRVISNCPKMSGEAADSLFLMDCIASGPELPNSHQRSTVRPLEISQNRVSQAVTSSPHDKKSPRQCRAV